MKQSKTYPNIDMIKTGLQLKEYIKHAGLTVKDIQEILHLSCPQPVYRWMNGKILPSVDHLLTLSKLFGVHMEDLYECTTNAVLAILKIFMDFRAVMFSFTARFSFIFNDTHCELLRCVIVFIKTHCEELYWRITYMSEKNMSAAEIIKELRESVGMTRSEFSAHTGIPVRTLEDWEAGRRTPPEYIPRLIGYQLKYEKIVGNRNLEMKNMSEIKD